MSGQKFTRAKRESEEQNLLSTIQGVSAQLAGNIEESANQTKLDVTMFQEGISAKASIRKQRDVVAQTFVTQAQELVQEHENTTALLTQAQNESFYDVIAWANNDPSTSDYLLRQRNLQGQLNKLAQDSTNVNNIFNSQIKEINQGLIDAAGLATTKRQGRADITTSIQQGLNQRIAQTNFELNTIEGMETGDLEQIVKDFKPDASGTSPFSPGLVEKELLKRKIEEARLKEAKKKSGKPQKPEEFVAGLGFNETKGLIQKLKASGREKFINNEGTSITIAMLEKGLTKTQKQRNEDAELILQANTESETLRLSVLDKPKTDARLNIDNATPDTMVAIANSDALLGVALQEEMRIKNIVATGNKVPFAERTRLEILKEGAISTRKTAIRKAAMEQADNQFDKKTQPEANRALVKYLETGKFTSEGAKDYLIAQADTQSASISAQSAGTVFGDVVQEFIIELQDRKESNFENSFGAGESDEDRPTLTLTDIRPNKAFDAINFQRTITKKNDRAGDKETNYWVRRMSEKVYTVQTHEGVRVFLKSQKEKLDFENLSSLTRVLQPDGTNVVRQELVDADNTYGAIANTIIKWEAQQIEKGSLTSTSNIAQEYIETMLSNPVEELARVVYSNQDPNFRAVMRASYGDGVSAAEIYLKNVYRKQVNDVAGTIQANQKVAKEVLNRTDTIQALSENFSAIEE